MSKHGVADNKAVFIFDGNKLVRQLLWLEFEAVLDGFVPLSEQASQTVHAVYLVLAPGPVVKAAVFFLINFDGEGFADQRWNIPLQQFAENSANGPDLGGGPIKLACRSQCSISWHQQQLWDPDMEAADNHFSAIKKAVQLNRLHFPLLTPPPVTPPYSTPAPGAAGDLPSSERKQLVQKVREQQLQLSTLQEKHRQQLASLKKDSQLKAQQAAQSLAQEQQLVARQQQQIAQLEDRVSGLQQKISGLREYFEHKLDGIKSVDKAALQALSKQQELEKQEAVQEVTTALEEQLQLRDVEILYRNNQVQSLQGEILKLQQDKQALLQNSGNQLLARLHREGISFVTFQPGAGQITLPLDTLSRFLEDKLALAAEKCGVTRQEYCDWLVHYRQPECAAVLANGVRCGQPLQRINHPADFAAGSSNRCSFHQQLDAPGGAAVSS